MQSSDSFVFLAHVHAIREKLQIIALKAVGSESECLINRTVQEISQLLPQDRFRQ